MTSQKDPCTFIYSCTRPLGGNRNRGGAAARFSAKWLASGEGPGVEELEEVCSHLWVVLGRREVLVCGGSTEQGGRQQWPLGAAAPRREGAVMAARRREAARERGRRRLESGETERKKSAGKTHI